MVTYFILLGILYLISEHNGKMLLPKLEIQAYLFVQLAVLLWDLIYTFAAAQQMVKYSIHSETGPKIGKQRGEMLDLLGDANTTSHSLLD